MSKENKIRVELTPKSMANCSKDPKRNLKSKTLTTATTNKKPTTSVKTTTKSKEDETASVKTTTKSKQDEKKPTRNLSTTSTTITKPQSIATRKAVPKVSNPAKPLASIGPTTKSRSQPLRAQHNVTIPNQIKTQQPVKVNDVHKKNVMNTVHNVTVSSPPALRRESIVGTSNSRERTRTRTLEPEEIVILKQVSNGPQSLDSLKKKTGNKVTEDSHRTLESSIEPAKEPVAFEILFDGDKSNKSKSKEETREVRRNELKSTKGDDVVTSKESVSGLPLASSQEETLTKDEDDYEDDFESYESDFESGSSTSPERGFSANETENCSDISESESSDASEETQLPITVVHKEDERKLDSGNYDMSSRRMLQQQQLLQQQQQQQFDSMDTTTLNSEQLDSGFSHSAPSSSSSKPTQIVEQTPEKPPNISKRGHELMRKIQLDEITFVLFELKPVNYEYYMKLYGQYNSTQSSTQTNEDRLETIIQTDPIWTRSMWTQHPAQYDLKFMRENDFRNLKNACGEFENDSDNIEAIQDPLSRSLSAMGKFRSERVKTARQFCQADFLGLNDFLHRMQFTVSAILNKPTVRKSLQNSSIGISQGYYNLNSKFLSATRVVKIFSNCKSNLLVMVHDDVEKLYSGDFRNLLSVWNINEPKNPFKLLSTWSEVCRAEICTELQDIIVAGLHDGSVALWDLKESYSFGVEFGDGSCYFPPTQTIAPWLGGDESALSDIGIVADIKTFRSSQQISKLQVYRPIQFASLNDVGIITVWTLVNLRDNNNWTLLSENTKIDNIRMEYNSPSARFKLIQSAIYNLRDFLHQKPLRPKSSFDKTRSYFENDLFSDTALKELQETNNSTELGELTGLRFTGIDVGIERVFIATNRDFIFSCTKTLKPEKFRKIIFENSKGLFATALRLLWNEEYLLVGFSNGSVIVYNCSNQQRTQEEDVRSRFINDSIGECNTPLVEAKRETVFEVGKSCAIQNLIRNERPNDDRPASGIVDTRPSSAFAMGGNDSNSRKLFDKQIILSGTVLRKDLVNTIELTNDANTLLALMGSNLRIFDFNMNSESICNSSDKIRQISLTKEIFGRQNLAVLTNDEEVQIHILK